MRNVLICVFVLVASPAFAKSHHHTNRHHHRHHWHHYVHRIRGNHVPIHVAHNEGRPADCYGIPWCGCWLKHALGVVSSALNLNMAREWAHWGRAASGPAPGVVGVMPHHVFKVVAVEGPGRVLAISGNDSHAVRTRVRSTAGVIAWRQL